MDSQYNVSIHCLYIFYLHINVFLRKHVMKKMNGIIGVIIGNIFIIISNIS